LLLLLVLQAENASSFEFPLPPIQPELAPEPVAGKDYVADELLLEHTQSSTTQFYTHVVTANIREAISYAVWTSFHLSVSTAIDRLPRLLPKCVYGRILKNRLK